MLSSALNYACAVSSGCKESYDFSVTNKVPGDLGLSHPLIGSLVFLFIQPQSHTLAFLSFLEQTERFLQYYCASCAFSRCCLIELGQLSDC